MALTKVKAGNIILTTPGVSSNDVTPATTQYVTTAIGNLIDTAPSTLNTLNELAAALGDDVNFSTTVTNSIATKLPLAGGTISASGDTPLIINTTNSNGPHMRFQVSGSNKHFIGSGTGIGGMGDADDLALRAYDNIFFGTGNSSTTRMTINASGNVGIGTTPEAYHSDYKAIDINNSASVMGYSGNNGAWLMENLYYGTDGNWKHKNSDFSAAIEMYDGVFNFYNTASGTADATATLQNRLKIDASGNVGIGTAAPDNTLHVHKGSAGTVVGNTNAPLTVENSANNYIQLLAPNANESGVLFGNPTNAANGGIVYSGANNALELRTNGNVTKMTIASDGYISMHRSGSEYGLELKSAGTRSGLVIKRPGTDTIDCSLLGLADSTYRLGTSGHYHQVMYQTGNTIIAPYADTTVSFGIESIGPATAKVQIHGSTLGAALVLTNDDAANATNGSGFVVRSTRLLTSNGGGWAADGQDPVLVIGSSFAGTTRKNVGIALHNESAADNDYSPGLMFTNKSNSGGYNTAYGYIMGKKTGTGVDTNWSIGEIHMDTAGTRTGSTTRTAYMDNTPAFKIDNAGDVTMPYTSHAYGVWTGSSNSSPTINTGWAMTVQRSQNMTYQNNASHGHGMTVTKAGMYVLGATGLYQPNGTVNYVYIGWCINGAMQHHWHSNHSGISNHDYVSSVMRYLNIGDHVTFEHNVVSISTYWGSSHSAWYMYKVG